jgi:hypothetical protein
VIGRDDELRQFRQQGQEDACIGTETAKVLATRSTAAGRAGVSHQEMMPMSLELILIFAAAVLSALLGQLVPGIEVIANTVAVSLFALFALVLRFQGVRKPVV